MCIGVKSVFEGEVVFVAFVKLDFVDTGSAELVIDSLYAEGISSWLSPCPSKDALPSGRLRVINDRVSSSLGYLARCFDQSCSQSRISPKGPTEMLPAVDGRL